MSNISNELIFTSAKSGQQVVNLNWSQVTESKHQNYQDAIEVMCEYMLKDEAHEKDYLFPPLLDWVKSYIQALRISDMPEKLSDDIERMNQAIIYIEEKGKTKERIDINFYLFAELLNQIFQQVDAIQATLEDVDPPTYED